MEKPRSTLWQRLHPPDFPSEEENRKAKVLFLLTKACFIGFVTILGIRIAGLGSGSNLIFPLFSSLFLISFSYLLILLKRLEMASYTLLISLFGLSIYLMFISEDGYHDTVLFAFPGLLVIVGILLKKWAFYIFTAITLLSIAVIVGLENLGIHETKFSSFASPYDGIDIIFIIVITAASIRILTDNLINSLQRAKENEKALQESEDKYRNLVQYAPTGIYEFDMEKLRFMSVNDVMCELTGYSESEFLKLDPFDLLTKESKEVLTKLVENVFANIPQELSAEYKIKGKNQREFWVLVNSRFFYKGNIPERAMAVVHDLTDIRQAEEDRKRLEIQLQQTHKMEAIGTLAGGIAHDFNNILSGIFGYSQLTKTNIHNPEKANYYIDQVFKGAARAAELVQQILTFSKQTEYQKNSFSIYQQVNEALKLLSSTIPSTIEIKKQLDSKSMISADPGKIHQVIMNLCTNAYHSMKKTGGRLTVALTDVEILEHQLLRDKTIPPGKYLKLEVSDTGYGMDQKTIEKAFDPFYTTNETGEGTGLGLAIVHAIVDEHDGYLEVLSIPGKGSSFYIYFPIVMHDAEPNDSKLNILPPLNGNEKIMFVDDESPIRQTAKKILESYGYTVVLFENGIKALQEFEKDPDQFDCIITDSTFGIH
jgi:PAS domain S-box-containing protein